MLKKSTQTTAIGWAVTACERNSHVGQSTLFLAEF
jgi:hypothetical protein